MAATSRSHRPSSSATTHRLQMGMCTSVCLHDASVCVLSNPVVHRDVVPCTATCDRNDGADSALSTSAIPIARFAPDDPYSNPVVPSIPRKASIGEGQGPGDSGTPAGPSKGLLGRRASTQVAPSNSPATASRDAAGTPSGLNAPGRRKTNTGAAVGTTTSTSADSGASNGSGPGNTTFTGAFHDPY
jgi:hypothetical protein